MTSLLCAELCEILLKLTICCHRTQVFKVVPGTAAGRAIGCRWLDDGVDEELAHFELGGSGLSLAVSFMGSKWEREAEHL